MANDQIKARLEYLRGKLKPNGLAITKSSSCGHWLSISTGLYFWNGQAIPEKNDICRRQGAASISGCLMRMRTNCQKE